jgi:hypothetical protein
MGIEVGIECVCDLEYCLASVRIFPDCRDIRWTVYDDTGTL